MKKYGRQTVNRKRRRRLACDKEVRELEKTLPMQSTNEHVPPHVWTDQSNSAATQDEAKDEVEVCVLCCQKRPTIAVCDECKEDYCTRCIDTHTCGSNVVCQVQYR